LAPVDNKEIRMMQVAVDTIYQGEGVGIKMVAYAENKAKEAGYSTVVMHAMLNVIGFYEKIGYTQEGDIFEENGITFAKMVKHL
jgi:ribosomal protein S18 acetylase RimI-like enzyme